MKEKRVYLKLLFNDYICFKLKTSSSLELFSLLSKFISLLATIDVKNINLKFADDKGESFTLHQNKELGKLIISKSN